MEWIKGNSGDFSDEITWKPTEPDQLVGKIVSKKTIEVGKYGPSVVMKIETEDGNISNVWMNRGGLKDILEQWDDELTPGREIGLRMTGMVSLPGGNTYYPYEIGFGGAPASAAKPQEPVTEEPF